MLFYNAISRVPLILHIMNAGLHEGNDMSANQKGSDILI